MPSNTKLDVSYITEYIKQTCAFQTHSEPWGLEMTPPLLLPESLGNIMSVRSKVKVK